MAATNATIPNQSLYIRNLPDKWQKEDLRRELYMLFSTYGPVLDITALKTAKMRGQAHVLFRDVQSATQAMRACQSSEVGGREMQIAYSKHRSGTLSKLTGTVGQAAEGAQKQSAVLQPPAGFPPPPSSLPAPPGSLRAPPSGLPPPPGLLPAKVNGNAAAAEVASPQGVKRGREESDDEGDAEEDDEGGEMEMSDED